MTSYWHPGSPVWVLELAILLTAGAVLVRERRRGGAEAKISRCLQ